MKEVELSQSTNDVHSASRNIKENNIKKEDRFY